MTTNQTQGPTRLAVIEPRMVDHYCQICDVVLNGETAAAAHENRHHDGAQTCWTAEDMEDERRRMWEENEAENEAYSR